MWCFVWEPVVSALITGGLLLLGTILTVWASARQTRQRGLDQHNEQNEKLDQLLDAHKVLDKKVDRNHIVASEGLQELKGKVGGVTETTDVLFKMIVDIDNKVTNTRNKKTKPLSLEEVRP